MGFCPCLGVGLVIVVTLLLETHHLQEPNATRTVSDEFSEQRHLVSGRTLSSMIPSVTSPILFASRSSFLLWRSTSLNLPSSGAWGAMGMHWMNITPEGNSMSDTFCEAVRARIARSKSALRYLPSQGQGKRRSGFEG